jgi:hypothetical protein
MKKTFLFAAILFSFYSCNTADERERELWTLYVESSVDDSIITESVKRKTDSLEILIFSEWQEDNSPSRIERLNELEQVRRIKGNLDFYEKSRRFRERYNDLVEKNLIIEQ